MKPEVDLKRIEDSLRAELTPDDGKPNSKSPVNFSVRKHEGCRVSCRHTDDKVSIHINPKRIRTQGQLDGVMADCREALV